MKCKQLTCFVALAIFISTGVYAQYNIEVIQTATDGICNGQINLIIDPTEPTPTSIYWSNGDTTQNIVGLCPGYYSVIIGSISGCETELGIELEGTGCFVQAESISADVVDHCGHTPQGGIYLNISNADDYFIHWDNGETGQNISHLYPGEYCVTMELFEDGLCARTECFTIGAAVDCDLSDSPAVIINEFSNGPSGSKEYVELLVVGDGSCEPMDLRGFIIDDNNGDFVNVDYGTSSNGISKGHIRFKNIARWLSIAPGTTILIYNAGDKNPEISLADDPSDSDNDHVYILPHTDSGLEGTSQLPTSSNDNYLPVNYSNASWSYVGFRNSGDAVQVRYPDGAYCHGISYGTPSKMSGGPDDLLLRPYSSTKKVFYFEDGDYRNAPNFDVASTNSTTQTPGESNNQANEFYIDYIFCDSTEIAGEGNGIIVNEFSNGLTGGQEYIELLVVGDKDDCTPVDIRGFIVDDNNGDFSFPYGAEVRNLPGTGISPGHIRFTYNDAWSQVPVGALILIYHADEKNASITLSDDPTDANGDYVYIIPSDSPLLEGQRNTPSVSQPYAYDVSLEYTAVDWNSIWALNDGDAIQVRDPNGNYIHGISYGNKLYGGPDDLHIHPYNGSKKNFSFTSGSSVFDENFEYGRVEDTTETPGLFNNIENQQFIFGLCGNHPGNNSDAKASPLIHLTNNVTFQSVYPNPFSDEIKIEIESGYEGMGHILLTDMLGRKVYGLKRELQKGMNKIYIEFQQPIQSGIYNLQVRSDQELLGSSIITCIEH